MYRRSACKLNMDMLELFYSIVHAQRISSEEYTCQRMNGKNVRLIFLYYSSECACTTESPESCTHNNITGICACHRTNATVRTYGNTERINPMCMYNRRYQLPHVQRQTFDNRTSMYIYMFEEHARTMYNVTTL